MRYPTRSHYKHAQCPYRIHNWPEYEAGQRTRGDLTIWFPDDAHALRRGAGSPPPAPLRPKWALTGPDDPRPGVVGLPGCAVQRPEFRSLPKL